MGLAFVPSSYPSPPLLGKRDIRLLTINHADPDADISCTLTVANLDNSPSYFALSYCWGGTEKFKVLECNGATLKATENLISAIKQLRLTYPTRQFWIDAVSINQDDLGERASQVQIMCDIYRAAEKVVVYLGEDTKGLDQAMELFDKLQGKAEEERISNTNTPLINRANLPQSGDEVWLRVHDFFNRPWFSRIWVIQEIAVASTDPIVLCGPFSISWSAIAQVARFLSETALTHVTNAKSPSANAIIIQNLRIVPHTLEFLLKTAFRFEATDPRDRVFALYGIAHPEQRELFSSPFFEVSYKKSVKDVYRDALLGCVEFYRSVDVMFRGSSPSYRRIIEDMPSWVPDWAIPFANETRPFAAASFMSDYRASGDSLAKVAWKPSPSPNQRDVLRISGKSHDEVIWVAEPFQVRDLSFYSYSRTRPQALEKLWNEVSDRLGPSRKVMDDFWRTLMANVDRHRTPLDPRFYKKFLQFWHQSKIYDHWAIRHWATIPGVSSNEDRGSQKGSSTPSSDDHTKASLLLSLIERYEVFKLRHKSENDTSSSELPCSNHHLDEGQAMKQDLQHLDPTKPPDWIASCKTCLRSFLLRLPELHTELGLDAALNHRASDPFIADYFQYIAEEDYSIVTDDEHLECHIHLKEILQNRAFFITREGRMGLGPWSTEVGDRVVILSGASVPAILRRCAGQQPRWVIDRRENRIEMNLIGTYTVVGEAYVHGVMGGEAVGDFDWDKAELFDLV